MDITSIPTHFISAQRLSEVTLPCVTVCHHISAGLYRGLSAQRLSEPPLPCVTVCHHISAGLYRSLNAQRLSERTVFPSLGLSPRLFCCFLIHFRLLNVEMRTARRTLIYRSILNISSHFAPNTLQVPFPISRQHICIVEE